MHAVAAPLRAFTFSHASAKALRTASGADVAAVPHPRGRACGSGNTQSSAHEAHPAQRCLGDSKRPPECGERGFGTGGVWSCSSVKRRQLARVPIGQLVVFGRASRLSCAVMSIHARPNGRAVRAARHPHPSRGRSRLRQAVVAGHPRWAALVGANRALVTRARAAFNR